MIDLATVEYKHDIKHEKLEFNFHCKECGTICNSITCPRGVNLSEIIQSYINKHSRLHELAEAGELTKKFITMAKDV